jgi:Domain of unknown function (DUF4253)
VDYDYPYELHRVPGSQALEKFHELRKRTDGVPIILGNETEFLDVIDDMSETPKLGVEALLFAADLLNPGTYLREIIDTNRTKFNSPDRGPWPKKPLQRNRFQMLEENKDSEVFISIIPTGESWKIPCYLYLHDYNCHPRADVHSALFKHWFQRYGAVPVCIQHDQIELQVERRPKSQEEALQLALEHYAYCPDYVMQGLTCIEDLAAELLNSSVWYFWWD